MSSTRIEQLIDDAQAAFDRRPTDIEAGLVFPSAFVWIEALAPGGSRASSVPT
ncbi:MAG: hypothetical protein V5A52_04660 [Halovenus sp.]